MTRKTPLGAEITVSDDGVGFDPEQPPQDGKGGRATGWRNKRRASAEKQV